MKDWMAKTGINAWDLAGAALSLGMTVGQLLMIWFGVKGSQKRANDMAALTTMINEQNKAA